VVYPSTSLILATHLVPALNADIAPKRTAKPRHPLSAHLAGSLAQQM
jgi:hypothetical protein